MRVNWNTLKAVRFYLVVLLLTISWRDVSSPLFDTIPSMTILGFEFRSNAQLYSLQILAKLSLAWAAYRPTFASLGFAMLGFGTFTAASYSMVYINGFHYLPHSENIHFFLLGLLALRCLNQADHVWLTKAMILVIGWSYFAAFLTKIRNVGFDWAWNETLPFYFKTFSLVSDNSTLAWLATQKTILLTIGLATLGFESLALPGLLWKRTRHLTIALALAFHTAVYLLFGIQFLFSYVAAYALIWSEDA